MLSVREILEQHAVKASAPCRIDSGGTWDIKALALPLEWIGPATVNMALNLRTWIFLSPFRDGWVRVSSEGFPRGEEHPHESLPFNSPLAYSSLPSPASVSMACRSISDLTPLSGLLWVAPVLLW